MEFIAVADSSQDSIALLNQFRNELKGLINFYLDAAFILEVSYDDFKVSYSWIFIKIKPRNKVNNVASYLNSCRKICLDKFTKIGLVYNEDINTFQFYLDALKDGDVREMDKVYSTDNWNWYNSKVDPEDRYFPDKEESKADCDELMNDQEEEKTENAEV